MSIWRFPEAEAVKGGWRIGGSPDSFSTRDKHAPNPVLRPMIRDKPYNDTLVVGIAGWLEEFQMGPFERVECNGTVICKDGNFHVSVQGSQIISVIRETDDIWEALDVFTNAIVNARRVVQSKKQAMGIFEGKEENYYEPSSPALFAEMTERGAREMVKETESKWRKENYPNWGSW